MITIFHFPRSSNYVDYLIVLLLYATFYTTGKSQIEVNRSAPESNFYEVQKTMNKRFEDHPNAREEKHWRRFESFYEKRLFPHGNVNQYVEIRESEYNLLQSRKTKNTKTTHGDWSFVGPTDLTDANFGRCNRLQVHPTDPNTLFVLTSSAGLWKSTDEGSSWTNLTDGLPYLFGTDFVVSHANPNHIFILTSNTKNGSYGLNNTKGIYYTTDGGDTWGVRMPLSPAFVGNRLIMHPTDANTMFAGMGNGIYRTTDGWQTAIRVSNEPNILDIEFRPGTPSTMYACSNRNFLKSTSSGVLSSWSYINDPRFGMLDSMFRVEIGVTPDHTGCVYLVASDNETDWVLRSLGSGDEGTWFIRDFLTDLWWGQARYNMGVTVDPTNFNRLFVMAIALWKSENGGLAGGWTDVHGTHVDHHDLIYNGSTIYDLNDGGVGMSTDLGATWSRITPGIGVFEAYTVAGTPQNTSLMYTGAQDTGGNRIDPGGRFVGNCACCTGDTPEAIVDYTNEDKAYMSAQGGGLRYTTDGWVTCSDTGPGGANIEEEFGNGNFLCPYEMDVAQPKYIYTGQDSMWRLDMDALTNQWLGYPGPGKTERIDQSRSNRNRMYIIHGRALYRTDEARTNARRGATWTSLTNTALGPLKPLPSDLATSPVDHRVLYVVYSGTIEGSKVYKTDDSGDFGSWTNISGSLPNVPINCIEIYPVGTNEEIYIGTDLGVFYRDNSMTDWVFFGNELPAAPVSDMYINTSSNKIYAATLGRGIWQSTLFSACPSSVVLLNNADEDQWEAQIFDF